MDLDHVLFQFFKLAANQTKVVGNFLGEQGCHVIFTITPKGDQLVTVNQISIEACYNSSVPGKV